MRRFRREAEAASRVPRHCTAKVVGYDLDHYPAYIATEYVRGSTLEEAVADGPLSPSELHGVAIAVADALTEIHRVDVVHGDLTPRNVLLSPSGPRVIDFGISRVATQPPGSSAGQILGTPPFMAPEQFDERAPVTSAADVFAWGSMMAFAGTGRQPFGNGPPEELRRRILRQAPDLEGLDPILRPIVEAAMRKDPVARPTAIQLRERLKVAARAANGTDRRDTIVADVLRSAEEQSDGRRLGTPVGWPQAPQHDYPPLPTTLAVLGLLGFAMAVWLHQPGRLGAFVNGTTSWLFGLGAWVMPLVAVAWAAGLPRRRRSMRTFWLLARAVKRNPRPGLILRALWSSAQAMVRSARAGPTAVLVAGLGLLHVARGTPPLNASRFEMRQSSGVLGGWFPDLLVYLVNKPPAVVLLLLLAGGMTAVFLRINRRWGQHRRGRQAAVAAALACLPAATIPAWYLKDHHYPQWVAFDGDRVAVLHGLSANRSGRWRPTRTTNVSRADVPAALHPQLERGIPVDNPDDGLQLASRLANAYRQTPSQAYHDQGKTLAVGTCLDDVQTRSSVPCPQPHGAEVYGIVTAPYPSVPPEQALDEFVEGACDALFKSYVGIPYDLSMLSYEPLGPTTDQWGQPNARAVACLAQPALSSVARRSLRGSREVVEDDFSDQSNWDTYDNDNCTIEYGDGALHLQKKEPGEVYVGTPETTRVDPSMVKTPRSASRSPGTLTAQPTQRPGSSAGRRATRTSTSSPSPARAPSASRRSSRATGPPSRRAGRRA